MKTAVNCRVAAFGLMTALAVWFGSATKAEETQFRLRRAPSGLAMEPLGQQTQVLNRDRV